MCFECCSKSSKSKVCDQKQQQREGDFYPTFNKIEKRFSWIINQNQQIITNVQMFIIFVEDGMYNNI